MRYAELFPIPIYYNSSFLTDAACKNIVKCFGEITGKHGALIGDAFSSFDKTYRGALEEIQRCKYSNNIERLILDEVSKYCKHYGILEPSHITNSWINVQNMGSSLMRHSHPFSVISGALYLNADADSFPLEFYNPNPFVNHQNPVAINKYNNNSYTLDSVNTGMLVLFPSWLEHGASILNNSSKRIVLSFNTSYSNV